MPFSPEIATQGLFLEALHVAISGLNGISPAFQQPERSPQFRFVAICDIVGIRFGKPGNARRAIAEMRDLARHAAHSHDIARLAHRMRAHIRRDALCHGARC